MATVDTENGHHSDWEVGEGLWGLSLIANDEQISSKAHK